MVGVRCRQPLSNDIDEAYTAYPVDRKGNRNP
jgi:hypothetical protein